MRHEGAVRDNPIPDFEGARQYVFRWLREELPATLFYHSVEHTSEDVLPAVERLGALAGLGDEDRLVLNSAALFHDTGFVEQYQDHEAAGARIAARQLPRFGYSTQQIERITRIILVTRLPETPAGLLEELMRDADLDVLGREDFLAKQRQLLAEVNLYEGPVTEQEWMVRQIRFLEGHTYYTLVARALRDEGKRRNLALLREQLRAAQAHRSEDVDWLRS